MDTLIKYPDKVIEDIARTKIYLFDLLKALPQTEEVKTLKSELEKECDINELLGIAVDILEITVLVLKE